MTALTGRDGQQWVASSLRLRASNQFTFVLRAPHT
jgi:hypothetical protein